MSNPQPPNDPSSIPKSPIPVEPVKVEPINAEPVAIPTQPVTVPTVPTQPTVVPTQPVGNSAIPVTPVVDEGDKKSFMLLGWILGGSVAGLLLIGGLVTVIILISNRTGSGKSDDDSDDSRIASNDSNIFMGGGKTERSVRRRDRERTPSFPGVPRSRRDRPAPPVKIEDAIKVVSFDTAVEAIKSPSNDSQAKGLLWLSQHTLSPGQRRQVLDKSADLMVNSYSSSVYQNAFAVILKHGDASFSNKVVESAKKYKIKENELKSWIAKYKNTKEIDVLAELLLTNRISSTSVSNVLMGIKDRVQPRVLDGFNSSNYTRKSRCRKLVRDWKIPERKLAEQCIKDFMDDNKSTSDALTWIERADPIEALKSQVTAEASKVLLSQKRYSYRAQVARILVKWGTDAACKTVADRIKNCDDEKSTLAYLSKFDNADSHRGIAFLMGDFRVGTKAYDVLEKRGKKTEPYVLELINDDYSRRRQNANKLIAAFKTDSKKIALQCVKDITTEDKSLFGRRRYATERLAKIPPQVDSDLAAQVVKAMEVVNQEPSLRYRQEMMKIALCNWAGPEQKDDVAKMVDDPRTSVCAAAIVKLIKLDPKAGQNSLRKHFGDFGRRRELTKALIAAGSDYEEAVHILLQTTDENQVVDALKILGEIGTKKSLSAIAKVSQAARQMRKRRAGDAAKNALTAIRARQ